MDKNRKAVLYTAGGAIVLIIMVLLIRFIINRQFSSRIPEVPNIQSLSEPVQEQISDAFKIIRRKPSAENLGMLGMVYHSSANYEQAAQCYQLAINRSKADWIWHYYQGYLKMEMGQSEEAVENFNRVIEQNPDNNLAWYYLGAACKNLRNNDLAEESFGKITNPQNIASTAKATTRHDHFPISTYAKFELSRIYFETVRMDLAETTLEEIIREDRSFGPAYRLLGNVYSMQGDIPLGEKYVVRANDLLLLSPPVDTLIDKLALLSRSELYLLKKIDEAENSIYDEWARRLVNHALQYIPDNKYLISKAIKIYLWMGLDEDAIAFMDRHISLFNENFTELHKTGTSFYLNELYQPSIEYLTRALDLEPDNIEVQKKLAISYWSVGEKQKSYDILDGLVEKNRDNPDVLADVANILFFNLKEYEKAIGFLPGLKQLSPSDPRVQKLSAGIAEKSGNFREAITMYESSFRGNPEDVTTIKYLGNLLFEHNMWDKSIRHYRKALEYHPNEPYFLERLGTYLAACPDSSLRNIEEGAEYLERAFFHISSPPNTLVSAGRSLAWAHAKLGDKQNAISIISQTINIGRREHISSSYLAELERLYLTFQNLPD
jgi:tetratricopeptide (TPR) repeat protein